MQNQTAPAADRGAANRANAQHSTGPRTAAGKQRSSLNALRHGLTGHTVVLPTDDLAVYQAHTKKFADEYSPKGPTEEHLVQALSDTAWRLNRIPALEANLFALAVMERADSISAEIEDVRNALAMAHAIAESSHSLATLSIIDQRLSRKFEKTLTQIHEIQTARRASEHKALEDAANLLELHKDEEQPFEPGPNGFELTTPEIELYIHRRDRGILARQADLHRAHEHYMAV